MSADGTPVAALAIQTLDAIGHGRPLPPGVEALNGGTSNHHYRLTIGPEIHLLRLGRQESHLLGIDRIRERSATMMAETLGVGAELLWTDPTTGALVTRFIRGSHLAAESAAAPATLRRIVESLRLVHAAPPLSGRFSPFDAATEMHEMALERGVVPPAEIEDAFVLLARIEAAVPPAPPDVPCHGDLRPGNLIDDGQRIRIIDWEYAAMGDRFFDLGNLASHLALSDEGSRELLESYFGEVRPADLARLTLMRLVSDLHESCRGFLSHAIAPPALDCYAYGTRHLNRFLRGARDDGFLPLLRRGSQPRMQGPPV